MEVIRSADNKFVKKLIKLKQKKYRDEYGEFFVEGAKNVFDSVFSCKNSVKTLFFAEKYAEEASKYAEFNCVVLSDALFDKVCETENSQGIISVHALPKSAFPSSRGCILLDRVRDPGNVGTILRTALAAGYDVVANNCADVCSPKVVRSAMSAVLKCNIGFDISVGDLKRAGYKIICSDMRGKNVFGAARVDGKYCIVIGNEAEGISDNIKSECDIMLSVPQSDKIESLNASVAAAVMMYALQYQNN